jgi:hypothetical protein
MINRPPAPSYISPRLTPYFRALLLLLTLRVMLTVTLLNSVRYLMRHFWVILDPSYSRVSSCRKNPMARRLPHFDHVLEITRGRYGFSVTMLAPTGPE